MTAIGGSCLCGGVKFEITGPLSSPLNCHCSQCRKQHGAPFRSRVRVQVEDFRWLQGEHLIKYYESAGGYLRGFCRDAGPRSSTGRDRTGSAPPSSPAQCLNTASRWPFSTIHRCGRHATSSSAARRPQYAEYAPPG